MLSKSHIDIVEELLSEKLRGFIKSFNKVKDYMRASSSVSQNRKFIDIIIFVTKQENGIRYQYWKSDEDPATSNYVFPFCSTEILHILRSNIVTRYWSGVNFSVYDNKTSSSMVVAESSYLCFVEILVSHMTLELQWRSTATCSCVL